MLNESLKGFGIANADLVKVYENPHFVVRLDAPVLGKVTLISGGGSGHEPLHIGYVGYGMLDAACPGEIFTSPTPDQILAAVRTATGGAGILFIVKNYAGDRMNFEMAAEMAMIEHAFMVPSDEVVTGDAAPKIPGRGMAGTVIIEKIVGAAAEAGFDLAACRKLGERANGAMRSMGVALTSCVPPAVGRPISTIGDDELELGVGIHGEPGRMRLKMMDADDLVRQMIDSIADDLSLKPGETILLYVNGLGGTPLIELYLIYNVAAKFCRDRRLKIVRSLVGNYTTSLEMAGCSITVCRLDDEFIRFWDHPVHTASLRWAR